MLLLAPLVASACMAAPPTPAATISIDSTATLASRSSVGGLCPDGPCSSAFAVMGDGGWAATDKDVVVADGSVSTTLKGNIWKGLFHLPRMQWYCWQLLDEMLEHNQTPG